MERVPQQRQRITDPQMEPQSSEGLELLEVDPNLSPADTTPQDDAQLTVVDQPLLTIHDPTNFEELKVASQTLVSFMERSYWAFTMSCACGTTYANNCAHFLTNAMALAGASFPASSAKCPAGRMIRAKEALYWFRSFATGFQSNHNSITSGIWFVYQESGGQGHVCFHRELPDSWYYRGTGDYPSWPIQWHYFY